MGCVARHRWLLGSALLGVVAFGAVWLGYRLHWGVLERLDTAALSTAYSYGAARPGWIQAWDVFCTVLGPLGFRLLSLVIIVVALVRRHFRAAGFVALSVLGSGVLTELVKAVAARPRPATALVHAPSTSFPSGHALGVMVGVLALLYLAWPRLRAPARGWLAVLGAMVIVLIGVGRVVLNVHHPSDVLAGWALGYAYFVLCVWVLPPVRAAAEEPAAPDIAR